MVPNTIGKTKSTSSKGLKELGNTSNKKLITIKPALLRASSLTSFRNSLLKKPHLTLFNKPSSIAFLNKKYLPQSLELLFSTSSGSSGSSGKGKQRLPTYQLATPIASSILSGTPSLATIEAANLKSTGTDKLQFITKPLFIPIQQSFGTSDNNQLKKLGSWNSLLSSYSNFNNFNNQLSSAKTSLPVFVFSSEKYNFNQDKFNFDENKYHNVNNKFNGEKFNDNNSSPTKLANNAVRNPSLHHPNAIQDVPFYSNSNDVNQTNSMKAANYNNGKQQLAKQPQFSHDFKPIVSSGGGANGFRTGRTIGFDKGQIRQQSFINEVKQSPGEQQVPKFDSAKLLLANNMDLELIDRNMDRSILSTIEKDIKLNNIKFIKSIIFPKKELKLDEKVKTSNANNANRNYNSNPNVNPNANLNVNQKQQTAPSQVGPDKLSHPSPGNQLIHGNNQMSHNNNGPNNINLNNNNYQPQNDQHNQVNSNGQINHNNYANQNSPQNFQQQQSVQHVLKLQSNNPNNNQNNHERPSDKQMNGNNVNNNHVNSINKDDRPEQNGQVKMPKFKIIQYADKGAIEEFTRALENIDFKSITQNDLAGLPEFVYDKLGNARIETIIGHRENTGGQNNQNNQHGNQQSNNYIMAKETNNNDYKEKSSGGSSFQAPPQMQYFGNNDKINSNDCAKNRKLRQMNSNGPQVTHQGNQQMNQQMNQQSGYQQGSSSQQKSYFNDQSNSITLNSLVNFDDQASFYSTSSTKLRQLKVLPNSEISPVITSSSNDNQFSPMNGNSMNSAGQLGNQLNSQIGNQMSNQMNNQMANQNNQGNQMSRSQMSGGQSGGQSNQPPAGHQPSHSNLNLNNELNDDFKKEINDDETDQFSNGDSKKQPNELDIETGDESTADHLDNLDGVSKKLNSVAGSGEADSLDPTKLDLKIIHLPVSVLKKLVQADGKKRKKR